MSKKGHHGGSWKVAYADFVTAMMALFLVLWLTAQDEKIKEAVERAFRHPFTSITKQSVGIIPNKDHHAVKRNGENGNFDSASSLELKMLRQLNQDLLKSLSKAFEDDDSGAVKLELTPEGIRINIFDRSRKPIFEPQTQEFTAYGEWVFSTLAWEIARHKNFLVELEGHTDLGNEPIASDYGDWEISSDRANASRRMLLIHGVRETQIFKVAGYAATQPIPGHDPGEEVNRRVTVLLKAKSTAGKASKLRS